MRASSTSLMLAALGVALPLLVPVHGLPLPSFWAECVAVVLGLGAFGALAWHGAWRMPLVAWAPLGLALVVGVQYAAGLFAYGAGALTAGLVLLWAGVMAGVGRTLAEVDAPRFWRAMAWALVISGVLNAMAGLAQFAHLDARLGGWVAPHSETHHGVWGNVAQQSHFALHMALALAGAVYLALGRPAASRGMGGSPQRAAHSHQAAAAHEGTDAPQRWRAAALVAWAAVAALLLAGLVLSGVRSGVLLAVWLLAMAILRTKRRASADWRVAAGVLVALVAVMAVAYAARAGMLGWTAARLMSGGDAGGRLFIWKQALGIAASHPLLGAGIDGFAAALVDRLADLQVVYGVEQSAHNLPLQLLATTGVIGLAVVAIPVLPMLRGLRQVSVAERLMVWPVLGMLAIQSLLDDPLYSAYFLGTAALFCGAVPQRALVLTASSLARPAAGLLAVAGLALTFKTGSDYLTLQRGHLGGPSLLAPQAEVVAPHWVVPPSAPLGERLRQSARLARHAPLPDILFTRATVLAEAGDLEAAKRAIRAALLAYPNSAPLFIEHLSALAASNAAIYGPLAGYAEGFASHLPDS